MYVYFFCFVSVNRVTFIYFSCQYIWELWFLCRILELYFTFMLVCNYICRIFPYICQFRFFIISEVYSIVISLHNFVIFNFTKSSKCFIYLPLNVSTFRMNQLKNNIPPKLGYPLYTTLFVLYFRVAVWIIQVSVVSGMTHW